MEEIKSIVAKNITELRQARGLTQLELAEKLNYSDKTVSKWERAESSPDISVLVELATLFGVTLDYLVEAEHPEKTPTREDLSDAKYNRRVISYISQSSCWVVAVLAYIITSLIIKENSFQFLYFVYALPITLIVRLVFNSVWFNPRHNYYIISLLMWSLLACVQVTFMFFHINAVLVYLLGVVGQIVIVLWSFLTKTKRK